MHTTMDARTQYQKHQVVLGEKAPWLSPQPPSWRALLVPCALTGVLFMGYWKLMACCLLVTSAVFGLCVLGRRDIKVCPGCYESVAGGAHRCRCGFTDGQGG